MSSFSNTAPGPHQGQPILMTGEPLTTAQAALVLLHGRGATAANILELAAELAQPGFAYLAPQASGNSWYPYPFLVPMSRNEPGLSSGLATISGALDYLAQAGFAAERTILLGFSQGACLMLEFVARHARRYGGVVGLSGGLIGPDDTPRSYPGSIQGTPAFLGCSDVDPHIPKGRVQLTTEVFRRLGASVTERLYPAMGHSVNQDEIEFVRGMMSALVASQP